MNDVTRALERSAETLRASRGCIPATCPFPFSERCLCMTEARAAVLAFLKEMPGWDAENAPWIPGHLAAAIEKEQT